MGCPVAPQRVSGCQWEPDNEGRRLFSHLGTGGLTGWLHGMINGTIAAVDCSRQTATVYNFDSSSERITLPTKGCNCTVYLQNGRQSRLEGLSSQRPIDVHSLQPQRNICFAVTARAAGPRPAVTLRWQKRVKVLRCGHQNGALARLSPLLKCQFVFNNHASTFYSEINIAQAWINNTGQSGDQHVCIYDWVLKVSMVDHC